MADINITRTHKLGKDVAKTRAGQMVEKMKSKVGLEGSWSGDVFNITKPAKGTFTITETAVVAAIDLPFLMRPLKGKIQSEITQELARSLA